MCEIYPEVDNCCYFCSVRVGMLFIGIFAIMSGAAGLGLMERNANVGYERVLEVFHDTKHVKLSHQAWIMLGNCIVLGISLITFLFIIAGLSLLFATLADQEGYAQLFIWAVLLNVVLGAVLILAMGIECITQSQCFLGDMDWLSGATILTIMAFYLLMWFYFICVANSYIVHSYA